MGRVTKTELNQQTARVLARVARGERLIVTDRDRPVAEIVPPAISHWDELVATGRVTPPNRSGRLSAPPVKAARSSREILDEVRADRL
ncbi:MAG TPA: type II toxin-antitoxin system prevent-host-death family antitoxin [Humibacter sp.]|jgi:prevent-host-death family protein|nr:type II toxin-antitoxin system prevent-host-death family antitoxin [Humibacter sp.]